MATAPASPSVQPGPRAENGSASPRPTGGAAYLVGIDIGGTNLRCALVDAAAPTRLLARAAAATPTGSEAVVALAAEMVARCAREAGVPPDEVAGIGCATPGILDAATGTVRTAVNLGWSDVPLRPLLEAQTGRPVVVENDVNAGALAEHHFGEATVPHSLAYLTVSTGIACGAVLRGRLLRGFGYAAGELGFLGIDVAALGDPARTLERVAGGAGLARAWTSARARGDGAASDGPAGADPAGATAADVFAAARDGHASAERLVEEAVAGVALAAAAVCCVLNPEVLVLGGSIAEHEPLLVERVRAHLARSLPFAPRVAVARLGGDAPLLGAVALAQGHLAGGVAVPGGA